MATSAFGSAFASARKAGKKTFTFNGKSFNTQLASTGGSQRPLPKPAAPTTSPTPIPAPIRATDTNTGQTLIPDGYGAFKPATPTSLAAPITPQANPNRVGPGVTNDPVMALRRARGSL